MSEPPQKINGCQTLFKKRDLSMIFPFQSGTYVGNGAKADINKIRDSGNRNEGAGHHAEDLDMSVEGKDHSTNLPIYCITDIFFTGV